MKSGNLNFLEPSGPLQACNRTALPFLPILQLHYSKLLHLLPNNIICHEWGQHFSCGPLLVW